MKKVPNSLPFGHLLAGLFFALLLILFSSEPSNAGGYSSICANEKSPSACADCFNQQNARIDAACMSSVTGGQTGNYSRAPSTDPTRGVSVSPFSSCQMQRGRVSGSEIDSVCSKISETKRDPTDTKAKSGSSPTAKFPSNVPVPPKRSDAFPNATSAGKTSGSGASKTSTPSGSQKAGSSGQQGGSGQGDDLACSSSRQRAEACCNNPESCLSSFERSQVSRLRSAVDQMNMELSFQNDNSQKGLRDRCSQMNSLGSASNRINNIYGGACTRAITECSSTCGSTCMTGSLASAVSMLNSQASMGGESGYGGNDCNNMTGAMPQNASGNGDGSGQGSNSPYGTNSPYNANANDPNGCQANPNSPACLNRGLQQAADPTGSASLANPDDGNANDFNVGSTDAMSDALSNSEMSGDGSMTNGGGGGGSYKTIPNNSGGGIPGGGGSSEAKLDPQSRGMASSGGPSVNTNIERGFLSGGGGGSAPGRAAGAGGYGGGDEEGGGYKPNAGGGDDPSGLRGLDLKRFLPGGSSDPGRFLGGNSHSSQINGPSINIWNRISDRLQQRCRLGLLYRCY